MSDELKVITKGKHKPYEADGYLYMTVLLPSPATSILSAKKAALESDANTFGRGAGIEVDGRDLIKPTAKAKEAKLAMRLKLTRPLNGLGISF